MRSASGAAESIADGQASSGQAPGEQAPGEPGGSGQAGGGPGGSARRGAADDARDDRPPRVHQAVRRAARVAEVLVEEPLMTVVAAVPDGDAIVLTGTSEAIWHRLPRHDAPPIRLEALIEGIAADAELPAETIASDIAGFVGGLVRMGVVELCGEGA